LTALIETIPAHWEARLLRAWIGDNVAEARRLEAEDPADPRAAWVLLCAAQKSGDAETRTDAQQALNALLKEPGAARRLSEFKALTEGRFQPPARLESASSKDRR
jgi:hypothetical protein